MASVLGSTVPESKKSWHPWAFEEKNRHATGSKGA
jgi:hypothetical protein